MLRIEHRQLRYCVNCGIRFVYGAHLTDWPTRLRELGLHRVYGLTPDVWHPDLSLSIHDCDGVFMGDIITHTETCPRCRSSAVEVVLVEYEDGCKSCGRAYTDVKPLIYHGGCEPIAWECGLCFELRCIEEKQNKPADPARDLRDAAKTGDLGRVRELLKNGLHPDALSVSDDRETALMRASGRGYQWVVRELIRAGADVNWQNESGWTALFNAASNDSVEVTVLLLKNGADPAVRNEDGLSVIEAARKWKAWNVVRALREHGVRPGSSTPPRQF